MFVQKAKYSEVDESLRSFVMQLKFHGCLATDSTFIRDNAQLNSQIVFVLASLENLTGNVSKLDSRSLRRIAW